MNDQEMKAWYIDFTAYFTPFNKPLPMNAALSASLLKKIQVFDPKTNSFESLFPDIQADSDENSMSEEQRKQTIEKLYAAAGNNTLVVPSEDGPVFVGIGEDGGPTKKPVNRENVEALYPPWNDSPVKKFFKRLVHGIFPNAFKEDFEKERMHEAAVRKCAEVEDNRDFTIKPYQKIGGLSALASERFEAFEKMPHSLDSFSMTLAHCVKDLSAHDRAEMNRSTKIQTNFTLFSSSYVLKNVSKEDAKVFLTGDVSSYSPELKQVITESHVEFEKLRQACFAENPNVDYEFRDAKASLETLKIITDVMLGETELSSRHKLAGILSQAYGKVLQHNRKMATGDGAVKLTKDDKVMLTYALHTLPTMGEIYYRSLITEESTLRRAGSLHDPDEPNKPKENPNAPRDFANIISRDVINSVLAENRQVLNSIPPEKAGTIPVDKLTSSMYAMLSNNFTEKNMYSLVAECDHASLAADPDFMVTHIFSSPEEKKRIGNVFLNEGRKIVFDKLSKYVEPSVEFKEVEATADMDMEMTKSQDSEPKEEEVPQETGVVKYQPMEIGLGR